MDNITLYCEEYLGKVFYFCLKKLGDPDKAGDLAGDISLAVLTELRRGTEPDNFPAWVWQIARNRLARMLREKYADRNSPEPAEDLSIAESAEETVLRAEDLALLRRELAFIRTEYRQILVEHYYHEKSVSEIARTLGIPPGTVKTRLIAGRKKLKEGMNMARTFGRRSYLPEEIHLRNYSERFGRKGQPWSILDHTLYKNIFLEVYGSPKTAEEVSMEMGIALPYMEEEMEYLVRETFLRKQGSLYETAFPILSRECQETIHQRKMDSAADITAMITRLIDSTNGIFSLLGQSLYGEYVSYETAKWFLLMDTVRHWDPGKPYTATDRPDHGKWDIIGYQTGDSVMLPGIGCHSPSERVYKYIFPETMIPGNFWNLTPETDLAVLDLVREGRWRECAGEQLDLFEEAQFIRRDGDGYTLNIVVCASQRDSWTDPAFPERLKETAQQKKDDPIFREALRQYAGVPSLLEKLAAKLAELQEFEKDTILADLPPALRKDPNLCSFVLHGSSNQRYILEEALRTGWLVPTTVRSAGACLIC